MVSDTQVLWNTAFVAGLATVMAVGFGLLLAWILTRTAIPGRARLERLMELPYYMTPLVGALAWGVIAAPKTGLANQLGRLLGTNGDVLNIYSPWGIAWVMALFEGTVAFVMISAAMKSMDPSMEESARVLGAGKFRVALTVTLPMILPGIVSATIFVFAEMLSAFAAAFVLGIPSRFIVITTVIWQSTSAYPPRVWSRGGDGAVPVRGPGGGDRPGAAGAAQGQLRDHHRQGVPPAPAAPGCQGLADGDGVLGLPDLRGVPADGGAADDVFPEVRHRDRGRHALHPGQLRDPCSARGRVASALTNSIVLGLGVATVGSLLVGVLAWVIFRARVPGRFLVEYVVMFPQAVPRLVFGLGLLWAWLWIGQVLPFTLYGTLWILGLAYLTVLLPLGVRTLAGVVLQIDKSLEECARVCGASWGHQMRTVTLPLMRPGIVAAWLLIFISSVRELGASLFLMGPHSKVIGPAIVDAWLTASSELSAAMALVQTGVVFIAVIFLLRVTRRYSGEPA